MTGVHEHEGEPEGDDQSGLHDQIGSGGGHDPAVGPGHQGGGRARGGPQDQHDPPRAGAEQVVGDEHGHREADHGRHQGGEGRSATAQSRREDEREELPGDDDRDGQQDGGGHGQEDQGHAELAHGMTALVPPDGGLGQQVGAEGDGPEDHGLGRHRDGGIGADVGVVEAAEHDDVDVLEEAEESQAAEGGAHVGDQAAPGQDGAVRRPGPAKRPSAEDGRDTPVVPAVSQRAWRAAATSPQNTPRA